METRRIGFLGGGNMATALISGLLERAGVPTAALRCSEPSAERRAELEQRFSITTTADNAELAAWAECVVVAVKPQVIDAALQSCRAELTQDKLLISIAAGVPIAHLQGLGSAGLRVIRAMPNTPSLLGEGATGIAPGATARDEDVEFASAVFNAVGRCWTLKEEQLDAVTGLSGSGPAYVMLFVEALADGGVRAGLPRAIALELAIQTVLGASRLLAAGEHPAVLKDRVTSPAGTTIEGVFHLERGGFRHAVMDAVCEATRRSAELGTK